MRSIALLSLAVSLVASGCYAYVPSSPQEVSPGDPVRFRLTGEEAARYEDLRLANPRLIEGTLVRRGDADMVLDAQVGRPRAAQGSQTLVQEVSIPLSEILEVELRRLDRTRTTLALVGGGMVLAAAAVAGAVTGGSDEERPPDVPEARRVPLIRFDLPLGGR